MVNADLQLLLLSFKSIGEADLLMIVRIFCIKKSSLIDSKMRKVAIMD